jgi:hypothetical protein
MQSEIGHITLQKKTEVGSLFVATLGWLIWITAGGCESSEKPAVAPPRATANASGSIDVNSPVPYFHADSGEILASINQVFRLVGLKRDTLDKKCRVWEVLDEVCDSSVKLIHPGPPYQHLIGRVASVGSASCGVPPEDWLGGTEESLAIATELTRDPEFVFKGNDWTVVLNVFNRDGSVDRWRLAGSLEPGTDLMLAERIDIAHLKPPGSFVFRFL